MHVRVGCYQPGTELPTPNYLQLRVPAQSKSPGPYNRQTRLSLWALAFTNTRKKEAPHPSSPCARLVKVCQIPLYPIAAGMRRRVAVLGRGGFELVPSQPSSEPLRLASSYRQAQSLVQ